MLISLTILGLGSVTVCELLSTTEGKLLSTFNKKWPRRAKIWLEVVAFLG
jgi:hypothetical protein